MRRKKQITPRAHMARIVVNSADAKTDKFMPLDEAKRLYEAGELHRLDMGPAYPDSFCRPHQREQG